jgi:hypothetical protein
MEIIFALLLLLGSGAPSTDSTTGDDDTGIIQTGTEVGH